MTNTRKDTSDAVVKLIKLGSNIAGSVTGAGVGAILGGPLGALIGSAYGPTLGHAFCEVGTEFYNRHLGKREKERIGAAIYFAIEKVQENIENGEQIRQDGFFQEQLGERAAAEEIIEGTVLAAQREHEEKKLRFYANLLANIAFHPEIDRAQANLSIRLGESISYRQMCLLALFARKHEFRLRKGTYGELKEGIYGTIQGGTEIGEDKYTALIGLLQEVDDLTSKGLLNCLSYNDSQAHKLTSVNPAMTNVQGMGATLHNLMELYKIDVQELNPIAELLR